LPEDLSDRTTSLAQRIAGAEGFIFDMDGTLVVGNAASEGHVALPGAVELLEKLRRRGVPYRVFTNGTAKPPAVYAASLRHAGLAVEDAQMMTPSSSAAAWFVAQGIKRVRVLGLEGVQHPLREAGLEVVGPYEKATLIEAVFTGWFREFTFPDLEIACQDVWNGAEVTTASNVPFFAANGGRAIGASFAINAMIAAMTKKRAKVLGKPARAAFECALSQMGLPRKAASRVVVVGDDPALEMRMARSAGAIGSGVTTGLATAEIMGNCIPGERPDAVLAGLVPLLKLWG
jgi:4-nitrophenyl phosphatase